MNFRAFLNLAPWLVGLSLLLGSATAQAQVVALGASNTAGKGVSKAQAFPAVLEALLRQSGQKASVANAGISGNTSADMLARLPRAVKPGTKVVLLQVGGNDRRKGISGSEREANIDKMRSFLSGKGIAVITVDSVVSSVMRSGMVQDDEIHLTVDGHKQVASQLLSQVQSALR